MGRRSVAKRRTQSPLKVVDLFCGAGGISEGFRQAGYQIVAGADSDPDATATFALNFPEAIAITGDLRHPTVRGQAVEVATGADVLVGGPPCQAFSQVRNHSRIIEDPRNSLYREFVQIVKATQPPGFVVENVTGLDQMGVRDQMLADLSLEGEYRVEAQVLDAADFGVPQTRKRLIFTGVHRSAGFAPPRLQGTGATSSVALVRFQGPRRINYRIVLQEDVLSEKVANALADSNDASVVSVADAISDLADLPTGHRSDQLAHAEFPEPKSAYQCAMRSRAHTVVTNVQVPRINPDTALRLEGIPEGGNYRDLPVVLQDRYITGHRWGQDNGSGLLSRRHFYAYRRLHRGIWAWTLNTKADSAYHYRYSRSLSVREFARLQSFPDRFTFTTDVRSGMIAGRHDGGPAHSRYRQVGNAVPPLLALAVARALLTAFADARVTTSGAA